MKRFIALVVCAGFLLGGCASGKFLGFLATTDYVDAQSKAAVAAQAAKIDEQTAKIDQQAAVIKQLEGQVTDFATLKSQAQQAIDQVSQTQKTLADLQDLAKRAEDRIVAIPREVIQQMIDALQTILNK
jgi:TolA-binding protein